MSNLSQTLDLRIKLEKWAKITIKRWQETLEKRKIGESGDLSKSFEDKVYGETADTLAVTLKFLQYGRYRDMMVHKGVKAYERNQNDANRQAATRFGAKVSYIKGPKGRWYNKPKMSQIHKMREILGIDLGHAMSEQMDQIANEISNTSAIY